MHEAHFSCELVVLLFPQPLFYLFSLSLFELWCYTVCKGSFDGDRIFSFVIFAASEKTLLLLWCRVKLLGALKQINGLVVCLGRPRELAYLPADSLEVDGGQ